MKSNNAIIPTTIVSMTVLLQFLAEAGVKAGHGKKHNDSCDKDEVVHHSSFAFSQKRE
jgi:hypothetical protein